MVLLPFWWTHLRKLPRSYLARLLHPVWFELVNQAFQSVKSFLAYHTIYFSLSWHIHSNGVSIWYYRPSLYQQHSFNLFKLLIKIVFYDIIFTRRLTVFILWHSAFTLPLGNHYLVWIAKGILPCLCPLDMIAAYILPCICPFDMNCKTHSILPLCTHSDMIWKIQSILHVCTHSDMICKIQFILHLCTHFNMI